MPYVKNVYVGLAMPTHKLYVLVRKDMQLSHIAVQAGHAVGDWVKSHPHISHEQWNDTLVYLGVADEQELSAWVELLSKVEEKSVAWREGYWNNSLTSFAVLGTPLVQEYVRSLKLI